MMNTPVRGLYRALKPIRSLPPHPKHHARTVCATGTTVQAVALLLVAALLAANALAATPAIRGDLPERPKIRIGAATISVPEAQGITAVFEVSLTIPDAAQDTTVEYTTVDATAQGASGLRGDERHADDPRRRDRRGDPRAHHR